MVERKAFSCFHPRSFSESLRTSARPTVRTRGVACPITHCFLDQNFVSLSTCEVEPMCKRNSVAAVLTDDTDSHLLLTQSVMTSFSSSQDLRMDCGEGCVSSRRLHQRCVLMSRAPVRDAPSGDTAPCALHPFSIQGRCLCLPVIRLIQSAFACQSSFVFAVELVSSRSCVCFSEAT